MIVQNTNKTFLFTIFLFVACLFGSVLSGIWPVPYRRYTVRPQSSSFCQAGVIPFCPTGLPDNLMPDVDDGDQVEIFALKKPVWQFKFGDTLGKFKIMHDALGFRVVSTGKNYTMEWYELFQLMNCTFAHVLDKKAIQWCNQGAVCIYPGIEDKLWIQNGTLVKVGTVSGSVFNKFADWVLWDNRTGLFYETWTVLDKPGGQLFFNPFDCASWVIRALDQFGTLGAQFNQSVHLNYTKINLYSAEPLFLGTTNDLFSPKANQTMQNYAKDIVQFYSKFQSKKSYVELALEILEDIIDIFAENHPFYLYYNDGYWLLRLVSPIAKLTYEETPLPKPGQKMDKTLYFRP